MSKPHECDEPMRDLISQRGRKIGIEMFETVTPEIRVRIDFKPSDMQPEYTPMEPVRLLGSDNMTIPITPEVAMALAADLIEAAGRFARHQEKIGGALERLKEIERRMTSDRTLYERRQRFGKPRE